MAAKPVEIFASGLNKSEFSKFKAVAKRRGWTRLMFRRALSGRGYTLWGKKPVRVSGCGWSATLPAQP